MARGGTRPGVGRPRAKAKAAPKTKAIRVPVELDDELYKRLPELLARIQHWDEELQAAKARGETLRTYEKLKLLLQEVKLLGYESTNTGKDLFDQYEILYQQYHLVLTREIELEKQLLDVQVSEGRLRQKLGISFDVG